MSDSSTTTEIRFAPYIEEHHSVFLDSVSTRRNEAIVADPYDGYTDIEIEAAFFGTGYVISSFPSLWDMYGKFMAGLDIEVLFDQIFLETTDGVVIHDLVNAQAVELSDDLENVATPRFVTGMRDINSVMSSTFVLGRELLEADRMKALSRFSSELRYRMIPVAVERWKTHLEWNRSVTTVYADLMKFYFMTKIDTDNQNYGIAVKDALWPLDVLKYEGAALGALTGARDVSEPGPSAAQKMLGGALTGLGTAAMLGASNPGLLIGGLLGIASGLI